VLARVHQPAADIRQTGRVRQNGRNLYEVRACTNDTRDTHALCPMDPLQFLCEYPFYYRIFALAQNNINWPEKTRSDQITQINKKSNKMGTGSRHFHANG
jgi:hypothetical protein